MLEEDEDGFNGGVDINYNAMLSCGDASLTLASKDYFAEIGTFDLDEMNALEVHALEVHLWDTPINFNYRMVISLCYPILRLSN